jgi:NADPH-dependent F420 reductase
MIPTMTETGKGQEITPSPDDVKLAVLGGTGPQGRGLARRLAMSGLSVQLGSRDQARAESAADAIGQGVRGGENAVAAAWCDVAVIAVPWAGHAALLDSLADELASKVVIDCVNPLGFDDRGPFVIDVPEGSATEQAAALLPRSRVVGAFHHVSAVLLLDPAVVDIDTDVLVVADDRPAGQLVQELAERINGVRGIYAGRLRNAHQIEALTANLIAINRRYKTHSGVRITNVEP